MKRKKLLVLLGAGSSCSHGLPSVAELDSFLLNEARVVSRRPPSPQDYFELLWRNREDYYSPVRPQYRPALNYEVVFGDLFALANWVKDRPYGTALRWLIAGDKLPPRLSFAHLDEGFHKWAEIESLATRLMVRLAQTLREKTRAAVVSDAKFDSYRELFRALSEVFDLGIYNMNHDNLALHACPGAFVGFDTSTGKFSAHAVLDRMEWNFVYHIHGSVHHSLPNNRTGVVEWRQDLGGHDFDDGGTHRLSAKATEDRQFPSTSLIVGSWKLDQLQMDPYHTFYSTLVRHLADADAILIGGYGFADDHIGNALRNRLARDLGVPIMILDYANPMNQVAPMKMREDLWSAGVRSSLIAGRNFAPAGSPMCNPPISISELIKMQAFEVSRDRPIAVWLGGFYQAAVRAAQIVEWLNGDEKALFVSAPT